MKTIQRKRVLQPVTGRCFWIGGTPGAAALDGGDAMLLIAPQGKEPTAYHVQRLTDGKRNVLGYRLTKAGFEETPYDLEQDGNELRCDCPDATHNDRPGGCKHSKALTAALAACGK